ncbi:B12-binding domain-containing protein [Candidatus Nitrosocosmicus hydrocola]|uniref:B12-binding domain-containing protein n=1 Tax=Candidatus Nitrosocosmicus hydrocola TaxID=1826872 RepID=UPI0011E5A78C|nr:B12-binding domain-containing protein [Candidatus Nitrosocosmicus hydrocola]
MYKKYNLADIQRSVIDLLQNNNPMSSSEIAKYLGTNRITISKYLDILYFQKIINRKKIGSVNFWFLHPGITNLDFQDENFLDVQQKLIGALLNGKREFAENIVLSLINRNINLRKIVSNVYLPVLNTILELYNRGKIGKTEKIHLCSNLSNSIRILGNIMKSNNTRFGDSQVIIISGDDDSLPICILLEILTNREGINSILIGNVENYIDPFFDIDLQRYVNKISKRTSGKSVIVVISNNETSIRFLYSTLIEADVQEKNQVFIFSNKFLKDKLEKNVSGTKMYIDFDNLLNDLEQKMAR